MYSSKSKITDLKNYFNKYKYTKKLLNYSNANKCNSLFSTSACNIDFSGAKVSVYWAVASK